MRRAYEEGHLEELLNEWSEMGEVDLTDWDGHEVLNVLLAHPEYREKFISLLQCRLRDWLQ